MFSDFFCKTVISIERVKIKTAYKGKFLKK